MQSQNPMIADFVKLANSAAGTFAGMTRGHLRMELPDGTTHEIGSHPDALARTLPLGLPAAAHIRVKRDAFFKKCVLSGDIGFAESYIDGDWETPHLAAVIAWFLLNVDDAPTLSGSAKKHAQSLVLNLLRHTNRLGHLLRPNTRETARRNISEHYDLSNDFFALWLDPSMMYSAVAGTCRLTVSHCTSSTGLPRRFRQVPRASPSCPISWARRRRYMTLRRAACSTG